MADQPASPKRSRGGARRRLILALALLAFAGPSAAAAERPDAFSTGEDWLERMTPDEKVISLVPPTILFGAYDIRLRHSLPEYLPLLDAVMRENPQFAGEDVANVFASAVYAYEPENRPKFRAMELALLQGGAPLHGRLRLEGPSVELPGLLRPEPEAQSD